MKAVALGGGHGTAVTLRALRSLTNDVTGIVSVADNGGSTGRLRDMLDVAAVGDIRKCLVALSNASNPLVPYLEHRFSQGDLAGHALGNLLLAGVLDATDALELSIRNVGEVLGITGTILPASSAGVHLVAHTAKGRVQGQLQVGATGAIRRLFTEPASVRAPLSAVEAILRADVVVLGPGSLFTSVLAACVVPGIAEALATTHAQRIFVANLHEQVPETMGFSLSDHLDAAQRHGVGADVVLLSTTSSLLEGASSVPVVREQLTRTNGRVHDAEQLAQSLARLVA